MFVSNGYVCASQPTPSLRVTNARDVGNLCMLVTFNTNETRLLDGTELLEFEAFAPLKDQKTFSSFSIEHGVLQWLDGKIDIAPEGLYCRTFEYQPEGLAAGFPPLAQAADGLAGALNHAAAEQL